MEVGEKSALRLELDDDEFFPLLLLNVLFAEDMWRKLADRFGLSRSVCVALLACAAAAAMLAKINEANCNSSRSLVSSAFLAKNLASSFLGP